jgi:hypothetical protein
MGKIIILCILVLKLLHSAWEDRVYKITALNAFECLWYINSYQARMSEIRISALMVASCNACVNSLLTNVQ